MSPEQVKGEDLDARSDIFSLGAVLYEMVTGRRAFDGKSELSVVSAILEKEPEPIATLAPLFPPDAAHLIDRCLAKDPEERWQTARDIGGELQWIGERGTEPTPVHGTSEQQRRMALMDGRRSAPRGGFAGRRTGLAQPKCYPPGKLLPGGRAAHRPRPGASAQRAHRSRGRFLRIGENQRSMALRGRKPGAKRIDGYRSSEFSFLVSGR